MNQEINQLSNTLSTLVEGAEKSLVRVDARRGRSATGVIWSADGIVITTDHTIENEEGIELGLPGGGSAPATFLGRDTGTDLAVLKTAAEGLVAPAWADLEGLKVGHLVLSLFRPGRTVRASLGIVSAFGEAWDTPSGGRIDRYLESDVALKPGYSGGLLLDTTGRALGVNTSGFVRGTGITVPTSTVRRVVEAVLAHGRVPHGYLGVGAHPVRLTGALEKAVGQRTALIVIAIEPGGPAEKVGLLLGDLLVSIDGTPTGNLGQLHAQLSDQRVGKLAKLRIVRGGEVKELEMTIAARP